MSAAIFIRGDDGHISQTILCHRRVQVITMSYRYSFEKNYVLVMLQLDLLVVALFIHRMILHYFKLF